MRAPKRRRPLNRRIEKAPTGTNLEALAQQVRYVGSPEHKDRPSFAGQPRPHATATICDPDLSQEELTNWLRSAIKAGHVGYPWEGGFPRYAWHKQGDVVYEARLVNQGSGEYKGWQLTCDEWPKGLD